MGSVNVSSMEDHIHALKRYGYFWWGQRPNTGVMCVRDDAYYQVGHSVQSELAQ